MRSFFLYGKSLTILWLNVIAQISTYDSAQDVGEIGNVVLDEDGGINVVANVEDCHQNKGEGNGSFLKAGEGR